MNIYGSIRRLVSLVFRSGSFDVSVAPGPTTLTGDVSLQLPPLDATSDVIVSETANQTLFQKTIDGNYNTILNLTDAALAPGAAIQRAKIETGSPDEVIINDPSGFLTSEAQLDRTRGGTGVSSTAVFPTSGTVVTETAAEPLSNKTIVVASNTVTTAASGNLTSTELNSALAELQGDIDTRATSSALTSHTGASTGVHGVTGAVVGTTDTQLLSNKTLTAPVINSPTGLVKGDVGLGNVDNTSDATKNAAAATLTNKIIDGANNTLTDKRWVTTNELIVKQLPGTGEYSTVAAALAAVTSPSSTNPYVIRIGPGIWTEAPLTVPSYVQLKGDAASSTVLVPSTTTGVFITGAPGASLSRLTVKGASGAGGIGVSYSAGNSLTLFGIDACTFQDCETFIRVTSATTTTAAAVRNCTFTGTFTTGVSVSASGGALVQCLVNGLVYNQPGGPAATDVIRGSGVCTVYVSDSIFTQPGGRSIRTDDGCRLFVVGCGFAFNSTAIQVDNAGAAPSVAISGLMVRSNTVDINIAHTGTTGSIMGNFTPTNSTIASSSVSVMAADPTDGITFTGNIAFGPTYATRTDYTSLFTDSPTMGVLSGGALTAGAGFVVNVASGTGYYSNGTSVSKKTWTASTVTLSASVDHYIYFDSTGTLTHAANLPLLSNSIVLGRVVTNGSTIFLIDQSQMLATHTVNANTTFFRKAVGPVFESGCVTTENVTPLHFDVTAGSYFLATKNYTPSANTNLTFNLLVGGVVTGTATAIQVTQYDNSGVLTTMGNNRWAKHVLYVAGDGTDQKYLLVTAQAEYASQAAAVAAPIGTAPSWFRDNVTPIAGIVFQKSTASIAANGQILDYRPRIGFGGAATLSTADHGNLTGLADDDHTQYLLTDGSRTLTGNMSLGSKSLTSGNDISAVSHTATGFVRINSQGELRLYDADSSDYLGISAGGATTTYSVTMPATQGGASTVLTNNGAGALTWSLPTASAGEINAVLNPSAVSDTTGWAAGTSHSVARDIANSPLSPATSTCLAITATANASESSTSGVGYTISTFPIGLRGRKNKVYTWITTPAADTWKLSVYTAGGTRMPLPTDVSGVTTLPAGFTGLYPTTFDADASTTSYIVRITRTAGTGTTTMYATALTVGPGIQPQGGAQGEPVAYTPTLQGFGTTPTSFFCYYVRIGSSIRCFGRFTPDTPSASEARLNLPTGLTVGTLGNTSVIGTWWCNDTTNASAKVGSLGTSIGLNYVNFSTYDTGNTISPFAARAGNLIATATKAIAFDFTIPVAELAGSGTVGLGQNDVIYAYNTSTTTTTDTTSFGYGPTGVALQAFAPAGTASVDKQVRFLFPIPDGVTPWLEFNDGNGWTKFVERIGSWGVDAASPTLAFGTRVSKVSGSSTDYTVSFFSRYSLASTNTWASLGSLKWRLAVGVSGQTVGFGEVIPGISSGLVSASGLRGATAGTAVATGYVGEKIQATFSAVSAGATTATKNVSGAINLTAGVWLVSGQAILEAQSTTAFTASANHYILISSTPDSNTGADAGNNTSYIGGSFGTPGNGVIVGNMTVSNLYVVLSSTTPYYLNATAQYTSTAPKWYGRITAVRIA